MRASGAPGSMLPTAAPRPLDAPGYLASTPRVTAPCSRNEAVTRRRIARYYAGADASLGRRLRRPALIGLMPVDSRALAVRIALVALAPAAAAAQRPGTASLSGAAMAASDASRLDASAHAEWPWASLHASGGTARDATGRGWR